MSKRKIVIGADSAGYELKEHLKQMLIDEGYEVSDKGTDSTASCHYPDYARAVCEEVQKDLEGSFGILICGTGIGMSMAANKCKGIRAALCNDTFSAKFTRLHNDANVLCMGARTLGAGVALEITDVFLNTGFEGGRHQTRVDMITALENKLAK